MHLLENFTESIKTKKILLLWYRIKKKVQKFDSYVVVNKIFLQNKIHAPKL